MHYRSWSCIDSVDIYHIDGMGEKPLENYGQKCVDVFCIDSVDIDIIEWIVCFDLCIDSVDKQHHIDNTQ